MADELKDHLNGAKNTFFGILKGIDSYVNLKHPKYVYHYTSWKSFYSMIETNSIRLHTIHNFSDALERKLIFEIETRIKGTIIDETTGDKHDFAEIINKELSDDHVFIQSNTAADDNKYLWKNYADGGKGVCLKLSTERYIKYLNSSLPDFDLLPDYFKCCSVSYDNEEINPFLEMIFNAIDRTNHAFGNAGAIAWFFYPEFWRNFIKNADPYIAEKEIRFVISDNYSLFLFACSLLAKWGHMTTSIPKEKLSEAFHQEYMARKKLIHEKLGLSSSEKSKFLSIPLDEILDSIIIGPKANETKDEVSITTKGKVKKSRMKKSFLAL